MQQKKSIGFGFRGWILIIVCFFGFMMFQVFTNYPLNILADFYGGAQRVAMLLTIGTFIGVVLQIIISAFIGKFKSIKGITAIVGLIGLICCIGVATIPFTSLGLWSAAYLICNITVTMYALFFLSILAGQWFPRRKGTVMGIATIAYPVFNGVIGLFANVAMAPLATGGTPAVLKAFLPFLILALIGYVLFVVFIKDYPEQVGAYRDNDRSITPEVANAMMQQEIENKRTTVWHTGHIFATRDFWFAAVTCGLLLMGAVGTMTQSNAIISAFPELNYAVIMIVIAICGAVGSWLLGVLDTKFGTKKSMIIATCLMILSGIFGVIAVKTGVGALTVISLILVAMFMGASSNYTVSVAAQYWRREDFSSVFACVNPIANIFNALAPTVVATIMYQGGAVNVQGVFIFLGIAGIIGTILMIIFSKDHVRKVDDKYRTAAGKKLDDELAQRL
ncbi:MAG: MFS transporter [Parasporobacterium sp.]|nr:MFS transporter [Parasporobacterium sp.]